MGNHTDEPMISSEPKNEIIGYIQSKRDKTDRLGNTAIDTIIKSIKWANFRKAVSKDGLELTVFELSSPAASKLFLLLYSKPGVKGYEDVQLCSVKNDGSAKKEIDFVCNYFHGDVGNYTGSILFLRISREFIYEKTFQNGELYKTRAQEIRPANSSGKNQLSPESQTCYVVVLITYWSDGSITTEIIGEYCVIISPTNCNLRVSYSYFFDKGTPQTAMRCNAAGSGGSSNPPDNCSNAPSATEVLNSFYTTTEAGATNVGADFINPPNCSGGKTCNKNLDIWKRQHAFGEFLLYQHRKSHTKKKCCRSMELCCYYTRSSWCNQLDSIYYCRNYRFVCTRYGSKPNHGTDGSLL